MKKSFKRFAAILLGLALLATSATAAFADGTQSPAVTFDGAKLDSNYTDDKIAGQIHSMQPGDSKSFEVEIRNDTASPAAFSLNNSVIQSLEETENANASGGAYTYELVYNPDDPTTRQVLFSSERIGGSQTGTMGVSARRRAPRAGGASDGLHEIDSAVGDENIETFEVNGMTYRYLGTLGAHQSGRVRMTVSLDGETQGNNYQNTLASLQLLFAVDPVTSTSRNETVTNRVNRDVTTVVQTGEGSDRLPFVLATGISGLLLVVLGILGMMDGRKAKKAAQKALCLALALTLACAAPAMLGNVARAADTPQYMVRVSAGAQGTFNSKLVGDLGELSSDKTVWTVMVKAGETLNIQNIAAHVQLNDGADSKYYVLCLREAGADNQSQNAVFNPASQITQDTDLVVGYGVVGDMVSYTVRYEDANGNQLLEPDTSRVGKVGDKPMVPFRYIEGYVPQAYNLTLTLDAVASRNVFTFVYTPIPENVTTTTLTELVGGGVVVIPGAPAAGGGAPAAPAGPGGVEVPEEETPLAPPEEVIDLDENPSALAGPGESGGLEDLTDNATPLSGLPMAAKVGIGIACAAVLGGAAFLIVKKRKKNDAEAS